MPSPPTLLAMAVAAWFTRAAKALLAGPWERGLARGAAAVAAAARDRGLPVEPALHAALGKATLDLAAMPVDSIIQRNGAVPFNALSRRYAEP